MRLTLSFICDSSIVLPLSYNEIVQGFVYSSLDESIGSFLHDQGYVYNNRRFKLFTFSRILGKLKKDGDCFRIYPPFRLIVSSPVNKILESLAENIVKKEYIELGMNKVYIESINVHFTPPITRDIDIIMLSPVTVYSTLKKADGSAKTYYYSPMEKEFSEYIRDNIIKKFKAIYKVNPNSLDFQISPINISKNHEKIITYKGFIIKAWMGKYHISGNPELIKLAYEAGIGSKNSQGFGCFDIIL